LNCDCTPPDYVFPQDYPNENIPDKFQRYGGMTLRDYFAGQALPGIDARGTTLENAAENAALCAYAIADAMLKKRVPEPPAKQNGQNSTVEPSTNSF
jgi:predicted RNase H-like HicB family nuclease